MADDTDPEVDIGDIESFLGDVTVSDNGTGPTLFGEPEGVVTDPIPEGDPGSFGDISQPVGDGQCDVCGAPTFRPPGLTKAGRKKRTPKYCDLHSPNIRVQGERPDLAGVESQLKRIQEELADDIRLLGTLAGPIFPVTGYYVFENADPFTIALLKLAKNNTRVLRVLHRAAQVAPIYTVAEVVAGTAYSVQVDQHKVDPHNTLARRLGVSRAYDAVYPEEAQVNVTANGFSPPPVYATVQ